MKEIFTTVFIMDLASMKQKIKGHIMGNLKMESMTVRELLNGEMITFIKVTIKTGLEMALGNL